jgi:hypothetical protein
VIAPGVEARGQRGRWATIEHGTADKDITARRAFYVDCDPVRPSGVQANRTEMNASVVLFQSVYKRLVELVGEDALGLGFSGSGMQIHLALGDVPNTTDVTGLIKAILVALDLSFSTAAAKIDTSVCDPKRLAPAWGTIKRKGASGHADRLWRPTAFVCHDEVKRLSLADLCSLLTELRQGVPDDKQGEIEKALGLKGVASATAAPSIPKTREPQNSDRRRP